jgi:tetratricopeptide (TPR) repeat protein
MNFNYIYVTVFSVFIILAAYLILPTRFDAAVIFRKSSIYDNAVEVLEKMEREQPGQDRVFRELIENLYQSGRYVEAAGRLENYLEDKPDKTEFIRQLALIYSSMQLPEKSIEAYERLLLAVPADSEALYSLNDYYWFLQMDDKAIRNLETIVELFPDDLVNRDALTELFIQTGRREQAIQMLKQTIRSTPKNLDASLGLAEIYVYSNDPNALDFLEKFHLGYPDREDIFDLLIIAMSNFGRVSEVPERFYRYYNDRLKPEEYFQRFSLILQGIPDTRNVIRLLEEQLKTAPMERVRFLLASFYQSEEMYEEAVPQMRLLIEEKPRNQAYWRLYLYLLWEEQYKHELVAGLEEYLSLWPDDLERQLQLAEAYDWVERYTEERNLLVRLINRYPANLEYRKLLARAYLNLGDYRRAAEQYNYMLSLHPDSAEYRAALLTALKAMPTGSLYPGYVQSLFRASQVNDSESALLMAELYAQSDSMAQAESYYRRALVIEPTNTRALMGLVEIIIEDRPGEALGYLAILEKKNQGDYQVVYRTARIYDLLSNPEEAAGHYRRFLELVRDREARDSYFIRQKAWALSRTGEEDGALELLRQGREMFADDVEMVNDYAEMLIERKQYDEAMRELDRIKQGKP